MFIYKITNQKNGKMYIGQTIRPVEERWKRHCSDALNNILDTHFARAIRYYTPNAFTIEIIDTATTQQELTAKESYWITWYDSVNNGYNETFGGDGRAYLDLPEEEICKFYVRVKSVQKTAEYFGHRSLE